MLRFKAISLIFLSIVSACATVPVENKTSLPDFSTEITIAPADELAPLEASIPPVTYIEDQQVFISAETPKKYPPLIYGAPKPLVCSFPYPPEKKLRNRPNLQVMWENYLYERPERVWAEIGGAVEYNGCLPEEKGGWRNACTVRLSHMLNKTGHKIPYIKGQTVSGRNGDQYFYRLDDAKDYISESFGAPDIHIDMPGQFFGLPNDPGLFIIKFRGKDFTGHATIWNGAGTVDGVDIVGYEIFFWELPCFIPPGRK